ncbi:MAG: signal peptide peptidase SppA [bacterium]|nr:signal peptide peptidase SppA [bacterium]
MSRGVLVSGAVVLTIFLVLYGLTRLPDFGGGQAGGGPEAIALIRIQGGIFGSEETLKALARFRSNRRLKALLLRIDSPGGAVGPTQEIYEEVLRLRRMGRKVVASLGTVAASGGYYVAVAADRIYANPGTITGSIGVVMVLPNTEKIFDTIGIRFRVIKSAPHKDLGSPLRKMTEAERKILQDLIDDTYRQFVKAISLGRKLEEKKVLQLADGSIFSGERALRMGLVDRLGTQQDAGVEAARLAGITGSFRIVELTPREGLLTLLTKLTRNAISWFGGEGPALLGSPPAVLQYMWK